MILKLLSHLFVGDSYHVLVVHMLTPVRALWSGNQRINNLRVVTVSDGPSLLGQLVEMPELDKEQRRLELVQPRVVPNNIVMVPRTTAVVPEDPNLSRQFRCSAPDSTAVAKGAKILGWVKAETPGVTEGSSHLTIEARPMALGAVFDEAQAYGLADPRYLIHLASLAEKVHSHNCSRLVRDAGLKLAGVNVEVLIGLNKNGGGPIHGYCHNAGDVRVGRYDYLVTSPNPKGTESYDKGIKSTRHSDHCTVGVPLIQVLGE